MGASVSSPAPKGRGGRKFYRPQAEINITPMVDIMLVLLVIFMVSAPLMTVGVNVNLPETNASALQTSSDPIIVTRTATGEIYVADQPVAEADLVAALQGVTAGIERPIIQVKADKDVNYQAFMAMVGTIYRGGFTRLALETAPAPP